MPKTVQQSVTLPASSDELFDMYLDAAQHAAITGAPVTIGREPGSPFRAFNDALSGTVLHVTPKRFLVQLWRSTQWKPADVDSTLVLTFTSTGAHGRIDLVHVNVADHDYDGVNEGWEKYYWTPWRRYLQTRNVG